jgi:hypothetical protein
VNGHEDAAEVNGHEEEIKAICDCREVGEGIARIPIRYCEKENIDKHNSQQGDPK